MINLVSRQDSALHINECKCLPKTSWWERVGVFCARVQIWLRREGQTKPIYTWRPRQPGGSELHMTVWEQENMLRAHTNLCNSQVGQSNHYYYYYHQSTIISWLQSALSSSSAVLRWPILSPPHQHVSRRSWRTFLLISTRQHQPVSSHQEDNIRLRKLPASCCCRW